MKVTREYHRTVELNLSHLKFVSSHLDFSLNIFSQGQLDLSSTWRPVRTMIFVVVAPDRSCDHETSSKKFQIFQFFKNFPFS